MEAWKCLSLVTEILIIVKKTVKCVTMSQPGEWKYNQKLKHHRLKQTDVASKEGKGEGGREQNQHEDKETCTSCSTVWKSDSGGCRKESTFLSVILML